MKKRILASMYGNIEFADMIIKVDSSSGDASFYVNTVVFDDTSEIRTAVERDKGDGLHVTTFNEISHEVMREIMKSAHMLDINLDVFDDTVNYDILFDCLDYLGMTHLKDELVYFIMSTELLKNTTQSESLINHVIPYITTSQRFMMCARSLELDYFMYLIDTIDMTNVNIVGGNNICHLLFSAPDINELIIEFVMQTHADLIGIENDIGVIPGQLMYKNMNLRLISKIEKATGFTPTSKYEVVTYSILNKTYDAYSVFLTAIGICPECINMSDKTLAYILANIGTIDVAIALFSLNTTLLTYKNIMVVLRGHRDDDNFIYDFVEHTVYLYKLLNKQVPRKIKKVIKQYTTKPDVQCEPQPIEDAQDDDILSMLKVQPDKMLRLLKMMDAEE